MAFFNKSVVGGAVVTTGTGVVLKKVRGALKNVFGSKTGNRPGVTPPEVFGKRKTKNFSFPLDVEGGPGVGNQGHYVMFYINEQEGAQLKFGGGRGNAMTDAERQNQRGNIPKYITRLNANNNQRTKTSNAAGFTEHSNLSHPVSADDGFGDYENVNSNGPSGRYKGGYNAYIERAPTTRLDTAIALYMPPSANYFTRADYADTPIGQFAALGMDIYGQVQSGQRSGGEMLRSALTQLGAGLSETMVTASAAAIGAVPGFSGTREAFEAAQGVVIADRLELAFKGLAKRKFQFSFKMIPKSQEEADEIRKIIYAFRVNMVPEMVGGTGRQFRVPNTFDISYMYNGRENEYLQKISTCVLENMTMSYGGDRYRTFVANDEGAPPVETQITLDFAELELITRERVREGY